MNEAQFNNLQETKKVQMVDNSQAPTKPTETPFSIEGFIPVLEALRRTKKHLTDHPTAAFIPTNFLDQIQFVDDGADQFVDIYINGHWYSFTGTLIV